MSITLKNTNVLVTGGAGFVGSHVVDKLIAEGACVTVLDNQSSGSPRFLEAALNTGRCQLRSGDLLNEDDIAKIIPGHDLVFHLAGNADVRHGLEKPYIDFEQNVLTTRNVLEGMRKHGGGHIVFASTSAIYGRSSKEAKREDGPFPIQTSLYGASKLAAEGLIEAYVEGFGLHATIVRFASMLGERYSHGHIFDFVKKLRTNPTSIEVLGDASARKHCIYIGDAVNGVLTAVLRQTDTVDIFNISSEEYYLIDEAVTWVSQELNSNATKVYNHSSWAGDDPGRHLDSCKLRKFGWQPQVSLKESVKRTVRYLLANEWMLERA